MRQKAKTIRCKRPDDVIVISPGPWADSLAEAFISGGDTGCGHPHLVLVGKVEYVTGEHFYKNTERAMRAVRENPLARVFVGTLAQQLGIEPGAVPASLVGQALGYAGLLDLLEQGASAVKTRIEAESRRPALYLPGRNS